MRGADTKCESMEEIMQELGPKGAAEVFIQAYQYLEDATTRDPKHVPFQPMTVAEWTSILQQQELFLQKDRNDSDLDTDPLCNMDMGNVKQYSVEQQPIHPTGRSCRLMMRRGLSSS